MTHPTPAKPLTVHEPDGSQKIRQLIAWLREDEARFRRDVATLEAGLAKAA